MSYRLRYRGSLAKWLLLLLAVLFTLHTLDKRHSAIGSLAAGLWISFAVLHAGDRLATARRRDLTERPVEPGRKEPLP